MKNMFFIINQNLAYQNLALCHRIGKFLLPRITNFIWPYTAIVLDHSDLSNLVT